MLLEQLFNLTNFVLEALMIKNKINLLVFDLLEDIFVR